MIGVAYFVDSCKVPLHGGSCGEAVIDGLDLKTFLRIETSLRVCQTIIGTNRIGISAYDAKTIHAIENSRFV